MSFRLAASIDANQHKGLILLNSISGSPLVVTGKSLTNSQPMHVAIVDGAGSQITSFGGGTQYAEGTTTTPGTGTLSLGRYMVTPPSLTDGQMEGLQLDSAGNLKITGSLSVGGTTDNSAFTAGTSTGTPAMGFYHSTIDTVTDGRAAAVGITSKRAMLVTLQTSAGADTGVAASPIQVSLANTAANTTAVKVDGSAVTQPISGAVTIGAGSAVIGHVITDTGSTTAVTGTVTISGAVTEATLDAALIVQEATTSGVKGLTIFGAVTTNAPTYTTAKSDALSLTTGGALRSDISTIAGTAPTTVGKLDIKGADGDVFVRQATASNLNATVIGAGSAGTANAGVVTVQGIASMTKLLVTPDSVALPANQSVNVSQINGVTPLMGNGVTGTGSPRVTIASDNTPFPIKIDQTTPGTTNAISIAQLGANTVSTGNGASGTGVLRVSQVNDGTGVLATVSTVTTVTTLTGTTTLTPGTGATNLGKAEDAGHTTGDVGVMALGVRNDTLAATTNATADYTQIATDTAGIVMTAGAPRLLKGRQATTITSSTAETTILTSVASTFLDVYGLILTNTSATVTKVSVRDATAGGTITVFEVPPTDTRGFMLPVDSAIPQAAVTNNWTAQCGTSVASLEVSILFVKRV